VSQPDYETVIRQVLKDLFLRLAGGNAPVSTAAGS